MALTDGLLIVLIVLFVLRWLDDTRVIYRWRKAWLRRKQK